MPSVKTPGWNSIPALRFALLFAFGIILGSSASVPSLVWGVADIAFLTFLLLLWHFRPDIRAEGTGLASLCAILLILSCGALKFHSEKLNAPSLPDSLLDRQVRVIGVVIDVPETKDRRTRFQFETEAVAGAPTVFRTHVSTTVLRSAMDTSALVLRYGDRLELLGELSRPVAPRNPGEFNPRQFLDANGLWGFLFVRGWGRVAVHDSGEGIFFMRSWVAPARLAMFRVIEGTVGGEEGEFLKGLLLGDRSGISEATKQAFIDSGVAHVLAVSGSNVAVVAAIFIFLVDLFRLPRAVRPILVAGAIVFYMLLTGSQPPVVRATIMALVFLGGEIVQRKSNPYNALGLSAMIILIWDSRQLFDVGFQLSFLAVLSIIHCYPRANVLISRLEGSGLIRKIVVWLLRLCAVSLVATLGTLPLTALSFGRLSIVGIAANLVVIPATELSVVLGSAQMFAAIFSTRIASLYGAVNAVLLHGTLLATRYAAALPLAYVDTFRFTALHTIPYYAALVLLFHPAQRQVVRVFTPVLLVGLNLLAYLQPGPGFAARRGVLTVSVIDVGQGDAILVEFPRGETMLIDGGPRTPAFDAGLKTVYPFLQRRGITRIDVLVVSHPHADHLGGMPAILHHFSVGKVIDSGQPVRSELFHEFTRELDERGCKESPVRTGTVVAGPPDARMYVLWPLPAMVDEDTTHIVPNLNNTSVVIRLLYGNISFLLAGDAEADAEREMVRRYGSFLQSSLLKAGHHGSNTSSSSLFLQAVHPGYVAVSVGLHNKFRHPSQVVLRRFVDTGAAVARTDEDGAVIYETDGFTLRRIMWR